MAAELLKGKPVTEAWKAESAERIEALRRRGVVPTVVVLRVGDDESAVSYSRSLVRTFEDAGVTFRLETLPDNADIVHVRERIEVVNADPAVHGIMIQEPVPAPLEADALALEINPAKDIDGVHPLNAGRLFQDRQLEGQPLGYVPATALGGLRLLDHYGVPLEGRRAVVIGRSTIVGRPLAMLLMHRNATVTICHSRTRELPKVCAAADILLAAVGRAGFVTPEFVKPGATVIDFGINFVDGKLVGDVDPAVAEVAGAMTPTPGGTGTPTTAALLANGVTAAERLG